jgi:hypothetical protein
VNIFTALGWVERGRGEGEGQRSPPPFVRLDSIILAMVHASREKEGKIMIPERPQLCPLCNLATDQITTDPDSEFVDCERCGHFDITFEASTKLDNFDVARKMKLSAYCRRASRGTFRPRITHENIEELVSLVPRYTPLEQMDNLLRVLGEMSTGLGQRSAFSERLDYPLVTTTGVEEISFLASALREREYLEKTTDYIRLTLKGWERLEEIQKAGRQSNRAFVAMWFDPSMNTLYDDAINPAILKAGYDPLRIDRHEHVNRIDDEIIGQIRRSRFMVADFTGQRPGVYFEAGLMHGLGRNVIWLCDGKELQGVHFDVRQFNFIVYKSPGEANEPLYNRILAIEGEGPGVFAKP